MHHLQLSSMTMLGNSILHFDVTVLDHMSASTLIHYWNMRKECFSLLENVQWPTTHMWHADHIMCGIYFAQTLLSFKCLVNMKHAADIPISAAIVVHIILWSSWAQYRHVAHVSSVVVADTLLWEGSLASSCPSKMAFILQFHTMRRVPSPTFKRYNFLILFSRAGNETLSQYEHPLVRNFAEAILGSLFRQKWRSEQTASFHHSPWSSLLPHSAVFHSLYHLPSEMSIQATSEITWYLPLTVCLF